jgi:hypothetical protein
MYEGLLNGGIFVSFLKNQCTLLSMKYLENNGGSSNSLASQAPQNPPLIYINFLHFPTHNQEISLIFHNEKLLCSIKTKSIVLHRGETKYIKYTLTTPWKNQRTIKPTLNERLSEALYRDWRENL